MKEGEVAMGKKILVIDDDPHVLMMVEARLKVNNYTVFLAANGAEGLEKYLG